MTDKFKIEEGEQHVVVHTLVDKFDSLTSPDIKSELVFLIKSGKKNIIVNLEQTRYVDSSGLSALLTGNRLCKDAKGSFVICCLQPGVEKLVQISQLSSVFEITPTLNEAIDIVMMDEIEREIENDKSEKK